MRIRELLATATIGLCAVHCSSEERAPEPENVIENHPGSLVITSPARAAFIEAESSQVTVKGTGATGALTINGEQVRVNGDGSFEAKVVPVVGLNVVVAVDGESRLETPFLYGHFAPATRAVPKAIAVQIGQVGIEAPLPNASLTSVTNLVLEGRDVIAMLKGKTFSGTTSGVDYSFKVTGGAHDKPKVSLNTAKKGLGVTALVTGVVVDGDLTIGAVQRPVRIDVERATVLAESELSIDAEAGALRAKIPSAETYLDGFRFFSNNAGFPCCVDAIVTGVLRPKVEEAIREGIKEQVPNVLGLTLEGVGLPKEIDFSAAGITLKLGVESKLDGGFFDVQGGFVTASTRFDGRFGIGSPGAKAPGWLTLERAFDIGAAKRVSSFGVSIALDAVNQALFAAWGSGTLSYDAPAPFQAHLSAALPPVLAITRSGALRLGVGEVELRRADSPAPFAAATMLQDVVARMQGDALVLEPEGEPTISITWLADDTVGSGRNLVAIAAKEQVGKLLKPFRLPVPRIALDRLGPDFAGRSLALGSSSIAVDEPTARFGMAGSLVLTK